MNVRVSPSKESNLRLKAIDALQDKLGYRFHDPELLELALTHASVA